MSDKSGTYTFPIQKIEMPIDKLSEEDAASFIDQLSQRFLNNKNKPYLFGSSRNSWFEIIITKILKETNYKHLSFLSGQSKPLNSTGLREHIYILIHEDQIDLVINELNSLLILAKQNPELFERLSIIFTRNEVLEALSTSFACSRPERYDEEGMGFVYLFGYIKMLQQIFEYAKAHDECVIHYINQPYGSSENLSSIQ